MSPWPPKMATGQDFLKKAVDKFIGAGGEREGFAHPHFKGWQGHPSLLHHPRAPKYPLKTPAATSPDAGITRMDILIYTCHFFLFLKIS